jgi:hypothetical protein
MRLSWMLLTFIMIFQGVWLQNFNPKALSIHWPFTLHTFIASFSFLLAELQIIPKFLFNYDTEISFKRSEMFSTLLKLPRQLQVDSSYNLSNVVGKYIAHLVVFLYQLYEKTLILYYNYVSFCSSYVAYMKLL